MELTRRVGCLILAFLGACGLSACDEALDARILPPLVGVPATVADDPGTAEEPAALAIAFVSSDYASSAIGVLSRMDGGLFHEAVFDSARGASGLSAALSGDIVLPSAPNPFHWLILIDRYPNAAVTLLDPQTFTPLRQFSVATGFSSNPQDLLVLDAHTAYVTRLNPNPHPGREPFDAGDDILIVDPTSGAITGRIAMPAPSIGEDGKKLYWRPCRLRRVGRYIYASLNRLSDDFRAAGEAALARLDPATHTLERIFTYSGLANPVGLSYDPDKDALYVACNGPYFAGAKAQVAQSGLLALDRASTEEPEWRVLRRASDDPLGRPFGFEIEVFAGRVIAVRNGDLAVGQGDRLVGVDPASGDEQTFYTTSSAYGSGGLLADRFRGVLYVGDADARAPHILRFKASGERLVLDGSTPNSPVYGLPPRFIRFY